MNNDWKSAMQRKFIIIGMDDNRTPFFPPEVLEHIRQGKVFSGGVRHKEIVGGLLPDDAIWISITVPLDNVFAQYEGYSHRMKKCSCGMKKFLCRMKEYLRGMKEYLYRMKAHLHGMKKYLYRMKAYLRGMKKYLPIPEQYGMVRKIITLPDRL